MRKYNKKNSDKNQDIAIIGIACRFPGAGTKEKFWENVRSGINSIREITPDRWDIDTFYSGNFDDPGKSLSKWCGLIENIDKFDNKFFNISDRESRNMDPQQRLLLQETWHCIEDAGIPLKQLQDTITSVYVGVMATDYQMKMAESGEPVDSYSCLGNYECILANRISYIFDLKGESISIDAACASSLLAIHNAKRALRNGESDFAIAAGISLNLHPWKYISFSKSRMLSPDGQCKTFDKNANGYVPGDGAGVILLQRLEDAVAQKNVIYGVLKGTAVNHVGKTISITAPGIESQKEVIVKALEDADISPDTISYIEAHGTGTSLGDPIEIAGLTSAYKSYTDKLQYCKIGSVKTNIGHLEAAAGIAGVIKVLMMLKHKQIPPIVNIKTINPIINFKETPFTIAEETEEWKQEDSSHPLRAGISSFGMGGVNSHAIIEEYVYKKSKSKSNKNEELFLLSAKSEKSFVHLIERWKAFIKSPEYQLLSLKDICGTLVYGRNHFPYRNGIIVKSRKEIQDFLEQAPGCFPGNETDFYELNVGHLSCDGYNEVKSILEPPLMKKKLKNQVQKLVKKYPGRHWINNIYNEEWKPDEKPLFNFMVQYMVLQSIFAMELKISKIKADGNGILIAFVLSGILKFEDVILFLINEQKAEDMSFSRPRVPVALNQKPDVILPYTISGSHVRELFKDIMIPVPVANHYMEKGKLLIDDQYTFKKYIGEWESLFNSHHIQLYNEIKDFDKVETPITGKETIAVFFAVLTSLIRLNARWNLKDDFLQQEERLKEIGYLLIDEIIPRELFMEILLNKRKEFDLLAERLQENYNKINAARYPLLTGQNELTEVSEFRPLIRNYLIKNYQIKDYPDAEMHKEQKHFARLSRMNNGTGVLSSGEFIFTKHESLAGLFLKIWKSGGNIDWTLVFPRENIHRVSLPGYVFDEKSFWITNKKIEHPAQNDPGSQPGEKESRRMISPRDTLLHDHEIAGETILPGASMIEMVYSSLAEKTNDTISLLEFIIHNPFIIKEKSIVDIEINQQEKLVRLKTDDTLLCMSHYHCNEKRDNDNEYRLPVPEITQCGQFPVDGLYTLFKKKGYHYGDSLQVITGIWILDERIIFEIKDKNKNGKSFISPALMDGILQTILFIAFDFQKERWDTPGMMFIPHKIESLYIHHPLVDTIYVELPLGTIEKNDKDLIFTARAFNREGTCLATADRIHFKQVYNNFLSLHDISLYTPAWQKKEVNSHNTSGTDKIRALFFGDIDDTVLKQHIAGDDYDSVMMVHHGKEYRENSATEVTINPGRQSDYFKLLDMILERNRTQDLDLFYIVTEPGRTGDYDFLNYFFHLCRALMAGNNDLKIKMIVITRDSRITVDSDRGTNFSQNSIVGFSKTLMKENPSIKIKVLDMDKGMAHDRLLQISIAEMKSEFDSPLVVYRDGARYIQKYRKMSFAATPGSMIKEKGVYCIAGGLGGIGFHLVSDMAKNFDIHMILLGRSALTGEIEQKINQLSRFNSHINYFQTDITNREEVKKTIDSIVETYGTIDGIIHAAGVIKDAWFIRKEWKDFAAVAAPKIQGTCYLNELTSHLKLDFFVVFSSIVSLTGNIGQIDYTAANSFIDSFIQYRKKNNYPGKSLGINWSLWSGTGMGKNKKAEMQLAGMGIEPLTVKQGLGGFYHALANTEGQVVIINGRNETFLQPYLEGKENTAAPVIPGHEDNNEVKEKEIDGEKLHDYLVGIFSEKSGCPPEDIDDETSFFNLGIDSIIIEDVMGLLDKKFEKLSTTLLFEHSHMKSLVEYLKTKKPKVNDFYHHNEPGNDTDRETDKNETGIQVNSILTTSSQSAPWPYPGAGKEDKGYDIAVIGMWGKFPLSPGLDEYWDNLVKGADCIEEIPGERWDYKKYFDPDIHAYNKTYGKWGGFIKDIDKFDPAYFGISPREAAEMDPQQRLLLECACEMMERAGYGDPDIYKDNLIGLFAGVMWNEYSVLGTQDGFMQNIYPGPGTLYWAIANRVSYIMDLRGPSIALDTACSSSLVAIDLACQSILRGDCHMAIAGGVNLNLHPSKYIYLGQAKFLSTDGRCRSFGKGGNGYVPGEGVGTILLKPLEKAIDDKDTIYGIVRGSATNHGGKAAGFTVPDVEAQSKVIVKAFERARIKAEDIGYIEAHGTGTSLGDPIEIKGITKAFEKYTGEKQFCPIGSVKSNIGHLEAASGIAGVIKILLSFKNHCIPKSIHNDELNPNIDFTDTPFFVVKENLEWQEKENKPLAAGISSFGAGGSNAHIILESFESENPQASSSGEGHLIVLSARSPVQLKEYAEKLLGYLEAFNKNEVIPLSGIAYTLQTGRKKMEERLAVHCYSIEDLMKKLTSYLADEPVGSVYYDNIKNHKKGLREIQKHEAGEAMLDDWIRSKDYHSLARYWVKGIKVEWRNLYGNNGMRKVSLPAYPFARERYWIPGGTGQTQIKGDGMNPLHPLLHRNISTLYEQLFSLVINPDDYFVNHHKVNKKKIVPGACYLEMANVAGIYSSQVMVRKITDVSWISAIVVNGSPAEVFTKIIPGENFLEYTIFTGDGKNQRIHGKGRMEMGEEATGEKEIVHYSELMHRLSNSINKESCYSYFKRIGLDYGNSFRVIAHASYNENEVLATLALPGNMEDAKNEWVINPFIIDAAFQSTLLPLKAGNELKTMCVPVSVKEITIFHTLNNLNYKSYAVRKPCNPRSSVYAFDIIIFDEDGMVCIKMEDLAIKQIQDFKNLKQENQPGTELEQNEIKAVNYV